ncbi:hypothetical protein PV326_010912, partial [Microctonus aethiopoides]
GVEGSKGSEGRDEEGEGEEEGRDRKMGKEHKEERAGRVRLKSRVEMMEDRGRKVEKELKRLEGDATECCSNVPNFAQLSERCCNIPAIFQWQCSNVNVAGMLLEHCSENITCECCSNVAGTLQWPHCGLWPFPN